MAQGYIRIATTNYVNFTREEDMNAFVSILNARGIEFKNDKEKYHFDDVEYEWTYSWSISFDSTLEELNSIMNEFNERAE